MVKFVTNLYNAYVGLDCSMLEINPLFKAADDKIIAVDCKMNLDENSLFRHADLAAMRDISEEDPTEVEAGKFNLNFVKLDGNDLRDYGPLVALILASSSIKVITMNDNNFGEYGVDVARALASYIILCIVKLNSN